MKKNNHIEEINELKDNTTVIIRNKFDEKVNNY